MIAECTTGVGQSRRPTTTRIDPDGAAVLEQRELEAWDVDPHGASPEVARLPTPALEIHADPIDRRPACRALDARRIRLGRHVVSRHLVVQTGECAAQVHVLHVMRRRLREHRRRLLAEVDDPREQVQRIGQGLAAIVVGIEGAWVDDAAREGPCEREEGIAEQQLGLGGVLVRERLRGEAGEGGFVVVGRRHAMGCARTHGDEQVAGGPGHVAPDGSALA